MGYEISKGTLAIVPNENKNSLVYEDDERYVIDKTPYKIMEESCKYFGSTYTGRKESARDILGADYEIPIVVEDSNNLIIFPTTSPSSSDCSWISLKRISDFKKIDAYNTKIIFDNGKNIIIPTSYRTIENQISRASRLNLILNKRKQDKI